METILQNKKECFICKSPYVEEHHIFFGTALRKISEKYGFKVWLCAEHHRGTNGVHGKNGKKLNHYLKRCCQSKYEETHTREDFIKIIGKNFL